MSFLHPNSIRQRLLTISMVTTLLSLLVAVTLFVVNDVRMLRDQMVRDLEVLAEVVGDNCLSALAFDAPETAEKNLASLRRDYQVRFALLYDADGRHFAQYSRDGRQILPDPEMPGEGVFVDLSLVGPGTVEVVRALTLDGQPVGRIFISAGMDELAAQLRHYAGVAAVLFTATLIVSLLLALRLQRQVSEPILRLVDKTHEITEKGDYGLRISPPTSGDEIAELFHGFNAMLEQIEARDLELNRTGTELEQANAQLRKLAMEISLVGEREKRCLASQLHDSPMQKLALAQAQIASAAKQRDLEAEKLLDVGLDLVREALQELRTLQFDLSPPVLYQGGLALALEWLASDMTKRVGVNFSFVAGPSLPDVEQDLSVALFQCARELVHNVIKHAEASAGSIKLDTCGGDLEMVVSDNGKGFGASVAQQEPDHAKGGYGLFSLRERVSLLGGELSIVSGSAGTQVSVRVPVGRKNGRRLADGRQLWMNESEQGRERQ